MAILNGNGNSRDAFQFGAPDLVAGEINTMYEEMSDADIKGALINALTRIDWLEGEVRRLERKRRERL